MLSPDQRKLLAAKLADFGNIAAGSLTFGALLREEAFTETALFRQRGRDVWSVDGRSDR